MYGVSFVDDSHIEAFRYNSQVNANGIDRYFLLLLLDIPMYFFSYNFIDIRQKTIHARNVFFIKARVITKKGGSKSAIQLKERDLKRYHWELEVGDY